MQRKLGPPEPAQTNVGQTIQSRLKGGGPFGRVEPRQRLEGFQSVAVVRKRAVGFNRQANLRDRVEQLFAIPANCRLHEQIEATVGPAGYFGPITAPDAFKPIRAAHSVYSILICAHDVNSPPWAQA